MPQEYLKDFQATPPALQEMLRAELGVGNSIVEVGHGFPAAPIGAYFLLEKLVTTRVRESKDGLRFRARNNSSYSGEFTDEVGYFFVLEPPVPEPEMLSMDEIRRLANEARPPEPKVFESTTFGQFERSMEIDYNKWHDGEGYEIGLIAGMDDGERAQLEALLIARLERGGDWRDVEALAELETPRAREAVKKARKHTNNDVRNFALDLAKESKLLEGQEWEDEVVRAVERAASMNGLDAALRFAAECSTPRVRKAVLDMARTGDATTRVNMAGLLYYLIGKAKEAFDWEHRPYFLQFGEEDMAVLRPAWNQLQAELVKFEEIQTA